MHKFQLLILFYLLLAPWSFCQFKISGTWQGLICKENQDWISGEPIYFDLTCIGSTISGESRDEKYNTNNYSSKIINGKLSEGKSIKSIVISQFIHPSKSGKDVQSCLLDFTLKYNDTTGYFEGNYTSTKCPNEKGKIILYKSSLAFNLDPKQLSPHAWVDRFRSDLIYGLSAVEKRQKELQEFQFEAIYFSYNSDSIPLKYTFFLNKMTKIILGHSDLRIKIIGNTDSDGSDRFNENLSLRRAESLTQYFEKRGLKRDRILIEYHGEKNPADSNKTAEGRRKNRRVEFKFI